MKKRLFDETEVVSYDLVPIHDRARSFYGKAQVTYTKNGLLLTSYKTPVCIICDPEHVYLSDKWDYSPTTLRHVKEFLRQNGYKAENKKQIKESYEVRA